MEKNEKLNSFLNKNEEIISECRIAGGEIYITNERIVTNRISLLKKLSLSSKTSFSSIPFADIVKCKTAKGMPFFSLPRLIVAYKEEKEKSKEVFFEFAGKKDLEGFCQALKNAVQKGNYNIYS